MLAHVGVLTEKERDAITKGLKTIEAEIERGEFAWSASLEDVHMNIEARLTERIGDAGKKLHTGRSRNDQVATDLRLYLRDGIDAVRAELKRLQESLLQVAEREAETIMPGFTHLQIAQPVTFGHHLMAWFEMLVRDAARLRDCRSRVNVLPLGAAALAGTSYPIDRAHTAKLLGFAAVAENSLDAVSDRDFAIEFAACAALIMTHLSRMSENWCCGLQAVRFRRSTGRVLHRFVDHAAEEKPGCAGAGTRQAGRVVGHLMALLMLMKAQPLAYNRDNQEDKEPVFDALDTVLACLRAFADMLPALQVKRDSMAQAARRGFSTATDLADYLVRKGVAFRDAHEIVGKAVRAALDSGRDLAQLALDELRRFSPRIDEDVFAVLSGVGARRNHVGGTAPAQVREAIRRAQARAAGSGRRGLTGRRLRA